MKSTLKPTLLALFATILITGCGKSDPAAAQKAETPPALKPEAAVRVDIDASNQPPTVVATPPPLEPPKQPEVAAQAQNASIHDLIAQARQFVVEKKYTEAAVVLQQLGSQALSTDQKTVVDALKLQVQQALAGKGVESAAGALRNALQK